jgi:hypothetical protein
MEERGSHHRQGCHHDKSSGLSRHSNEVTQLPLSCRVKQPVTNEDSIDVGECEGEGGKDAVERAIL